MMDHHHTTSVPSLLEIGGLYFAHMIFVSLLYGIWPVLQMPPLPVVCQRIEVWNLVLQDHGYYASNEKINRKK